MPSSEALYRDFTAKWGALREVTAFSIPSWLAIGASVQLLSQSWLPAGMGYWLPLLYIVYRAARVCVDSSRIFKSTFTDVKFGGWTAKLPEPEDPSAVTDTSDGVVMFLLGTRINHPLGKLAPGATHMLNLFGDMWVEVEKNRVKWSYLGRTAALYDITDREGMTIFWISYWKDLKALQRFSASALHRAGMNAYGQKKHPYCGLMHETYHAPKGSWENLYGNMPPTGLGKAQYVIEEGPDGFKLGDTLKKVPTKSSLYVRMGREKPDQ